MATPKRPAVLDPSKFETVYIPVKNLSVVWIQSQRPFSESWAKEIADNLDPDKFDPIIVTKPNGEGIYHIIEGQHRRHALEMYAARLSASGKGDDEMAPCRVVGDADPARAAEIWLGISEGRRSVRPIHGFKVAVVARREPEVTINSIVTKAGFRISDESSKQWTVHAVAALKLIYNRHGDLTLRKTLDVLKQLWDGDPQSVAAPLLRGFALFIHEFGLHVDVRRLKARVADRFSPWKFKEGAEARRESTLEKLDQAIAEMLLREYNTGLKDSLRLRHKS